MKKLVKRCCGHDDVPTDLRAKVMGRIELIRSGSRARARRHGSPTSVAPTSAARPPRAEGSFRVRSDSCRDPVTRTGESASWARRIVPCLPRAVPGRPIVHVPGPVRGLWSQGLYGACAGAAPPGRPTGAATGKGTPCGRFRRGRVSTSSAPRSERRAVPASAAGRARAVGCGGALRGALRGVRRARRKPVRGGSHTRGRGGRRGTGRFAQVAHARDPRRGLSAAASGRGARGPAGGAADPGRAAAAVAATGVAGRAARARRVGRLVGALGARRAGRGPLVRLPVRPRDRRCGRRGVLPGADRARRRDPGARRAGAGTELPGAASSSARSPPSPCTGSPG